MRKIRISKSNFMGYDFCKYLYKKEVIDGIRGKPTDVMLRGILYHKAHDDLVLGVDLDNIPEEENERYAYVRSFLPDEDVDDILHNMAWFETDRLNIFKDDLSRYKPVIVEEKFTKVIEINDVEITMVGKPDHVYREEDGSLNILELKTGNWKPYKKSKIRKELCFYAWLLEGQVDGEINNISWLYPKVDYFDTEIIKKRTMTAVRKQFERMIESYELDEWDSSYNEHKCQSCQHLKECVFRG